MAVQITCLRSTIKKNGKIFPVLIGMASGRQIHSFSFVPNFSPNDSNLVIAQRLLEPLEDKWQRPADQKRISNIGELYTQDSSLQVMVNPVLLGAIPGLESNITILNSTRASGTGNQPDIVQIEIKSGSSVWVIDGQHRINGMRGSTQPMPFVLLYDETPNSNYTGAYLAELFSIVTTEAKPMKTIHKEWMMYAFNLAHYQKEYKRELMKITLQLATSPVFGATNSDQNLFYGEIQFNDALEVNGNKVGAFSFTAQTLLKSLDIHPTKTLIQNYTTEQIAAAISDFLSGMKELHGPPKTTSLLFGKHGKARYTCIGAGLVEAWLWYLSTCESLPDFYETTDLLRTIGVANTNWELLTWPSGPGTVEKNAMRQTIRTVFYQLMTKKISVPQDLGGFLIGKENTTLRLEFGVQIQGKFIEQSVESVEIDPFKQREMTILVPKFNGQNRNAVRHYYLRSKNPNDISGHTPNCRMKTCVLVNQRGQPLMPPDDCRNAFKKMNTGLDFGVGRFAYLRLEIVSLNEKKPHDLTIALSHE
jgi:hypothetical protein